MKSLLIVLGSALLAFVPAHCSAELICFQGTSKEMTVGSGNTSRLEDHIFLVVDHDTAHLGEVTYRTTADGNKIYSVSTGTNYHIAEITGANQTTNSAISRPLSESETDGIVVTEERIFASGTNAKLAVNTNATISFPRTLTTSGRNLYHVVDADQFVLSTWSRTFNFDKQRTVTANSTGATRDETIASFTAYLESLGYSNGNAP